MPIRSRDVTSRSVLIINSESDGTVLAALAEQRGERYEYDESQSGNDYAGKSCSTG